MAVKNSEENKIRRKAEVVRISGADLLKGGDEADAFFKKLKKDIKVKL